MPHQLVPSNKRCRRNGKQYRPWSGTIWSVFTVCSDLSVWKLRIVMLYMNISTCTCIHRTMSKISLSLFLICKAQITCCLIYHINREIEPRQANLCLRAFCHDKFQLRMPSHSEGPGIWLSVWRFLLIHCLYERAAKVLARLRGCAGSPEPSLLA